MAFEVQLLGQKITLKALGETAEAEAVLKLVNDRLKSAEHRNRDRVPHHVVLLALLDIAEDYVRAKTAMSTHQQAVQKKTGQILEILKDHGVETG
jgi:hypothetical protein